MNIPTKMLLFILCIDAFLFLGQIAVLNLNPGGIDGQGNTTLQAFDSHLIKQYNIGTNGEYVLQNSNTSDIASMFPNAQQGVGGSDANGFADIWNTIKDWIFTSTPLGIILQIVGAPYFFLKAIMPGIEQEAIVFTIGAIWYAFSIFSIIAWALGRE